MSRSITVFAVYRPNSGRLIRLWERSWRLRGWKVRLLTPREVFQTGDNPEKLIRHKGGGLLVSLSDINYSFKRNQGKMRIDTFGKPGWQTAPVVFFSGATEEVITNCGRAI